MLSECPLFTAKSARTRLILGDFRVSDGKEPVDNSDFQRVVGYFLEHGKPKGERQVPPKKRPVEHRQGVRRTPRKGKTG